MSKRRVSRRTALERLRAAELFELAAAELHQMSIKARAAGNATEADYLARRAREVSVAAHAERIFAFDTPPLWEA